MKPRPTPMLRLRGTQRPVGSSPLPLGEVERGGLHVRDAAKDRSGRAERPRIPMSLLDTHSSNWPPAVARSAKVGGGSVMPSRSEQKETPAPITVAKGGRGRFGAYGPTLYDLRR